MRLMVSMQEGDSSLNPVFRDTQQLTITYDSPHFIGTPTAPTAEVGNNSTQLATTEFVTRAVSLAHFGYGNIVTMNVVEVTS